MQLSDVQRAELLSVRDACAILSLGRTKVDKLIADGEIPAARVGRKVVLRRRDVDAYVERLFGEEGAA